MLCPPTMPTSPFYVPLPKSWPSASTATFCNHLAWSFARWRRCSSVEYVEFVEERFIRTLKEEGLAHEMVPLRHSTFCASLARFEC